MVRILDEKLADEMFKTSPDTRAADAAKAARLRKTRAALTNYEALVKVLAWMVSRQTQASWGASQTPRIPQKTLSNWARRPAVVQGLAEILGRFVGDGQALTVGTVGNSGSRTFRTNLDAQVGPEQDAYVDTEQVLAGLRRGVKQAAHALIRVGAGLHFIKAGCPADYMDAVDDLGLDPDVAVKLRRLALDVADNDQSE